MHQVLWQHRGFPRMGDTWAEILAFALFRMLIVPQKHKTTLIQALCRCYSLSGRLFSILHLADWCPHSKFQLKCLLISWAFIPWPIPSQLGPCYCSLFKHPIFIVPSPDFLRILCLPSGFPHQTISSMRTETMASSLLYSQLLRSCPAYSRCSINPCQQINQ